LTNFFGYNSKKKKKTAGFSKKKPELHKLNFAVELCKVWQGNVNFPNKPTLFCEI
jgi:hypothetical protein